MKRIKNILIILLALAFRLFLTTPLFGGTDGETHSLFFMVMSGIDPDMGACARRLCLGGNGFRHYRSCNALNAPRKGNFRGVGAGSQDLLAGIGNRIPADAAHVHNKCGLREIYFYVGNSIPVVLGRILRRNIVQGLPVRTIIP